MSLEHILLGMLHDPSSGYDIKTAFSEGARHFWSAELSQIYPTLKKLEKRGWLKSRTEPSSKGPPRRVYRRNAAGRRELLHWIGAGPQMGTERFAYVAQLCFMHELDNLEATTEFMLELRGKLSDFLTMLLGVESELTGRGQAAIDSLSAEDFHVHLALRMGIHSMRAKVRWCDEALTRIKQRQQPRAVRPRGPDKNPKEVRHG